MSGVLVAGCAAFGAAAGIVTPRAAFRLAVPHGNPARTACDCGANVASWLRAGRACERCDAGPGGWLPAGVGAAVAAVLAVAFGPVPQLPVFLAVGVLGLLLAFVDAACLRLPDPLVALLAAVGVVPLSVLALVVGEPQRLGRAACAAGVCFAAFVLLALLPRGPLGFGDVKLAAALGFPLGWLGWPPVLLGLALPHLLLGPVALALLATGRARRDTPLPFGPALLAGALLAVVLTSG